MPSLAEIRAKLLEQEQEAQSKLNPLWRESKKTSKVVWRKDKFGTVYIVTTKYTRGYSGNYAKDLRVIYTDKSEKYFDAGQVSKFVGSKIRGRHMPGPNHTESSSERNGNRLPGNYSRASVQGNVIEWVDEIIANKESASVRHLPGFF
ncbi:MAG: hypothetical protein P8N95_06465 [Paracoccaceae bacterium]|nr:hypothetical protein [Paracoccaceae bacterium]